VKTSAIKILIIYKSNVKVFYEKNIFLNIAFRYLQRSIGGVSLLTYFPAIPSFKPDESFFFDNIMASVGYAFFMAMSATFF